MSPDFDNLEEFLDPAAYDREDPNDDGVAFYCDLARETGGPVLELGCGTGRVAIPIARMGLTVTGVDVVPAMVKEARRKAGDLPARWIAQDARRLELDERFALVYLTGNAFQFFLDRDDQEALLARVRAHLRPDGLFAFETRNPVMSRGTARSTEPARSGLFTELGTQGEERPRQSYLDAEGRSVSVSLTQEYDRLRQLLTWTKRRSWSTGRGREERVTRITVRFTFPQELASLLHSNGFRILRQFGDWDLRPLGPESPSIIVVCAKSSESDERAPDPFLLDGTPAAPL